MRPTFLTNVLALLVVSTIVIAPLGFAQGETPPLQTRPRRVHEIPPDITTQSIISRPSEKSFADLNVEPTVRIGLTTDARSVTISTTGKLLSFTDEKAPSLPDNIARVRIEPRILPSLAPTLTQEQQARTSKSPNTNNVQLTARRGELNTRVAVVYASDAAPLLNARAPITFASDADELHLLKYDEKLYRGRLEVFVNERGSLTVVNVVALEDYVRGVVPNELSPGSYPEIEALKAQAVAARTYALSHQGQFTSEGFDLLPSTRSQVYGGRQTEHPLTDRAVAETRGRIATFAGEPINALYTSTCGGRTEDAEKIFGGEVVPYLRGRECAVEAKSAFVQFTIKTSRAHAILNDAAHISSAREAALLAAHNFKIPARLTDDWLAAPVSVEEVRSLLSGVALLARQPVPSVTVEATRAPGFSSALALAVDGESRGDILLNGSDIDYILAFRDADDIPPRNRADVAMLLRDGHLALYSDATLRPHQSMTRAQSLHTIAHFLESRSLLSLQKATARPSLNNALVLRTDKKSVERNFVMSSDAYLFRAFGENLYGVREVTIVGGEAVTYHTNARGEVDYLEVRPAPNGASPERFSPFTNWTVVLTPAEIASRLSTRNISSAARLGALKDLRVITRGVSRRVLDLEVAGTNAMVHLVGGRIRSALGLREQLFAIDRRYDENGEITEFIFTGRGWGHGVGMCQVGAYGLARAGLSYDRILESYYTGIRIAKLY